MNTLRAGLALATWAGLSLALTAAPAPPSRSQGPVTDFLRLRGKVPQSPAPRAVKAQVSDEVIEYEQVVPVYQNVAKTVIVERDGKPLTMTVNTPQISYTIQKYQVPVKGCKFFRTNRDGKLEPIDADKALALLKKVALALSGDSDEVDPRHLALVKPGTLYIVTPPATAVATPPVPVP